MYKFQTSRGPDNLAAPIRDAECVSVEGEGMGRGVPLPSRLGGLGTPYKLSQLGPQFWRILELEKHTL